jgi:hypothetical protein
MANRSRASLRPILWLLTAFVLLSLADLYLTWRLIHQDGGRLLESNPVAGWWLATYGWAGMAAFKGGIVVLVGVLAGVIARRRPRAGELMLVYSCGAQSAVVVYSLFLPWIADEQGGAPPPEVVWLPAVNPEQGPRSDSPRSSVPGVLPENGLLLLLGQKAVQAELHLSEAQGKGLAQLAERRLELRREFRQTSREEWDGKARRLQSQEQAFLDDLTPKQEERLRQIAWQQRGPFAFADPEVGDALLLTSEQEEAVRALAEEARKARPSPGMGRGGFDAARRFEEDLNRIRNRLLALLTAEQSARWKEMLGEPFQGETQPRWGSRPGMGREARPPRR